MGLSERQRAGGKRPSGRANHQRGKPFREGTRPAEARRARVRRDPRVHRALPPPLSASRLPSARAPSLPALGGGDAASAAASPVASFSLTGEPGGGGTFGARAVELRARRPASGRSDRLRADPTDGRTAEQPDGPSRLKFRHELGHRAVGEFG